MDIYPHFYNGQDATCGTTAFASTVLGNRRGVWLYLPPSFDENPGARFPVLYMHDGQNLFDPRYAFLGRTWRVAETLNAGIDALDPGSHLPELVVVGPENTSDRIYEYTPTPGDDPATQAVAATSTCAFVEELRPRSKPMPRCAAD